MEEKQVFIEVHTKFADGHSEPEMINTNYIVSLSTNSTDNTIIRFNQERSNISVSESYEKLKEMILGNITKTCNTYE